MQNPGFWSGLAQFTVICVVAASAIWMLSANARREIEALAIANGDSVQWSLAQSEVEFRTYIGSLQDVLLSAQADVQEVRNRFDVFYSRFQTLRSASTFKEVRDMPGVAERLETIEAYLYAAIPTIDSDDDELLRSLPDLLEDAKPLGDDVREVSLAGVRAFASEAQSRRKNVAGTLFELGTIMFLLLAIVLAAVRAGGPSFRAVGRRFVARRWPGPKTPSATRRRVAPPASPARKVRGPSSRP